MKRVMRKTMAFMLALTLVLSVMALGGQPMEVKAAGSTVFYVSPSKEIAAADVTITKTFVSDSDCVANIVIFSVYACDLTLALYDNLNVLEDIKSFSASEGVYLEEIGIDGYGYAWQIPVKADRAYSLKMIFSESNAYILEVSKKVAGINKKYDNVTVGFTTKLEVSDGEVVEWKSSNTKIATVKDGKVTGKKVGNCKITAVLSDGTELTCDIVVKKNVYSATKGSVSDGPSDKLLYNIYKMSYDSKGNIIVKVRAINNTATGNSYNMNNSKVYLRTASGKVIGSFTIKKGSIRLSAYSYKDYTYTIKKANLKIKKADLRTVYYSK